MFKVAALGTVPAGFHAEPMKNDADINKFSRRYFTGADGSRSRCRHKATFRM